MKVKDIAKKYSMASNAKFVVDKTRGAACGRHAFSKEAINEMLENNAPIMNLTVGMIIVKDNTLIISAY